jgi:hypothetical protein
VIISACSTVPLSDIKVALGNWSTVLDTTSIVFHTFPIRCISAEKANIAGRGYLTQDLAWRLSGCLGGNARSVVGLENHEDKVKFNGTVYVLTVTLPTN